MNATFDKRNGGLLIWFGQQHRTFSATPIENLPSCSLVTSGDDVLLGFPFYPDGVELIPQILASEIAKFGDDQIKMFLESSHDPDCDMGYIRFDDRGPASVKYSIDCGFVVLDVGNDGAVIGVEVFSPTKTCPLLIGANAV